MTSSKKFLSFVSTATLALSFMTFSSDAFGMDLTLDESGEKASAAPTLSVTKFLRDEGLPSIDDFLSSECFLSTPNLRVLNINTEFFINHDILQNTLIYPKIIYPAQKEVPVIQYIGLDRRSPSNTAGSQYIITVQGFNLPRGHSLIKEYFTEKEEKVTPPYSSIKLKSLTEKGVKAFSSTLESSPYCTSRIIIAVYNMESTDTTAPYKIILNDGFLNPDDLKERLTLQGLMGEEVPDICRRHLFPPRT